MKAETALAEAEAKAQILRTEADAEAKALEDLKNQRAHLMKIKTLSVQFNINHHCLLLRQWKTLLARAR